MEYLIWLFLGFSPNGLVSEDFDKRLEYQDRFDENKLNFIPAYLNRNHENPEVAFRCNKVLKTVPGLMEFTAKVERFVKYNPFTFAMMKEYPKEWDKYNGPLSDIPYRDVQLFKAVAGFLDLLEPDDYTYTTPVGVYGRVWSRVIVQAQTGISWKLQREVVAKAYQTNKFVKP